MTEVILKDLAKEIQTSVERLIQKFQEAGLFKSENDIISQKEKEALLIYLNRNRKKDSKQLNLQKKTRSTLSIPSTGGKNKSIQIEFRKQYSYIKGKTHADQLEIELKQKLLSEKSLIKKDSSSKKNNFSTNLYKKDILEKEKQKFEKTSLKEDSSIKNSIIPKKKEKKIFYKKEVKKIHATKTLKEVNIKNKYFNKSEKTIDNYYFNNSENKKERNQKKLFDKHNHFIKNNQKKYNKNIKKESFFVKNKKTTFSSLKQIFKKPNRIVSREIILGETITVLELANKMAIKSSEIIRLILEMGINATINQTLDQKTAKLIVEKMGHKFVLKKSNDLESFIMKDRDLDHNLNLRAPVVTIMGHVDHGKTSLLDYIRSSKVASSEPGGITQHIGAYHIKTKKGNITFLDTPGHAAFTAMRARGIKITDIVILMIAADDGVMPQTIEAIQHAKIAKTPIIVAINKIDKLNSNINNIKNELTNHGILSEEWGGENIFVNISAKLGTGVDNLLDAILLQSEMLELYAIHKGMAKGIVIESFLDKGKGPAATILVKEGTLKKGNIFICGTQYGRIRSMHNELSKTILEAGPSIPVKIFGLSGIPNVGDEITVVRNEKKARQLALLRQNKFREKKLSQQKKIEIQNIFSNVKINKELNVILKADTKGSLEAILQSLLVFSSDDIKIKIIGSGIGFINDTDANLAITSHAIIIGFNVQIDTSTKRILEKENLNFRCYSVIYHLLEDFKKFLDTTISPKYKKNIVGLAEVRNVFKSQKNGTIAGCMILEGQISRKNSIQISRKKNIIFEGELNSLRRFKEDVHEVRNGMECGIGIKNFNDVQKGDLIEILESVLIKQ